VLENDAMLFLFTEGYVKGMAVCKRLTKTKAKPDTGYLILERTNSFSNFLK